MTIFKGRTDADPATRSSILLSDKPQFDLDCVGYWVASPGRLELSNGISALCHEHLDSVIDFRILESDVSV